MIFLINICSGTAGTIELFYIALFRAGLILISMGVILPSAGTVCRKHLAQNLSEKCFYLAFKAED